jgi:serine/threonine-protein kinase
MNTRARLSTVVLSLVVATGCGGSNNSTNQGTGGITATGGLAATGGASGTGGAPATGGIFATGGISATGGFAVSGGARATGGIFATGGISATGGVAVSGGARATGGISSAGGISRTGGGASTTGGIPATGGVSRTGGVSVSGGASVTGGISSAGGISSRGGVSATGGVSVSGGASITGGISSAGGVSARGGTRATGGVSTAGGTPATGGATSTVPAGATLFPAAAPFYQDISTAALDSQSSTIINGLSAKGGWGAGSFRIDFSIEVLKADASVTPRAFTQSGDFYDPDCDPVPIPVPATGRLEGESNYTCASDGDCHLIVIQGSKLYEMWRANITGGTATGTPFDGGCLAVWDLTHDYWQPAVPPALFARGDQCTSADAGGFPITALLFSADEVASGSLNHAIRFILPNDRITKGAYVHPATHSGAGKGTPTTDTVPYGARLRLKSSFNLAGLPNQGARTVARALQRYGMLLSDGGNIALTAQADTYTTAKWSGLLGSSDLSSIKVTDFEMVDGGTRIPLTLDCTRTPLK